MPVPHLLILFSRAPLSESCDTTLITASSPKQHENYAPYRSTPNKMYIHIHSYPPETAVLQKKKSDQETR